MEEKKTPAPADFKSLPQALGGATADTQAAVFESGAANGRPFQPPLQDLSIMSSIQGYESEDDHELSEVSEHLNGGVGEASSPPTVPPERLQPAVESPQIEIVAEASYVGKLPREMEDTVAGAAPGVAKHQRTSESAHDVLTARDANAPPSHGGACELATVAGTQVLPGQPSSMSREAYLKAASWRSAAADDGRLYYYHRAVRTSLWELPDGVDPALVKHKGVSSQTVHAKPEKLARNLVGELTAAMDSAAPSLPSASTAPSTTSTIPSSAAHTTPTPAPLAAPGPQRDSATSSDKRLLEPAAHFQHGSRVPAAGDAESAGEGEGTSRAVRTLPKRSNALRKRFFTPAVTAPSTDSKTHGKSGGTVEWVAGASSNVTPATNTSPAPTAADAQSHGRLSAAVEGVEAARKPCPDCGRRFAPGALEVHVRVCARVFGQTPARFDSKQARVRGTPAAKFHDAAPPCPHCDKRFSHRADLLHHVKICPSKGASDTEKHGSGASQPFSRTASRLSSRAAAKAKFMFSARGKRRAASAIGRSRRESPSPTRTLDSAPAGAQADEGEFAPPQGSDSDGPLPSPVAAQAKGGDESEEQHPLSAAAPATASSVQDTVKAEEPVPDFAVLQQPARMQPGQSARAITAADTAAIVSEAPVACVSCGTEFQGTAQLCSHLAKCEAWAQARAGASARSSAPHDCDTVLSRADSSHQPSKATMETPGPSSSRGVSEPGSGTTPASGLLSGRSQQEEPPSGWQGALSRGTAATPVSVLDSSFAKVGSAADEVEGLEFPSSRTLHSDTTPIQRGEPAQEWGSAEISQPQQRVPCPHCSRQFAPEVAPRHIFVCAKVMHRPDPPSARARREPTGTDTRVQADQAESGVPMPSSDDEAAAVALSTSLLHGRPITPPRPTSTGDTGASVHARLAAGRGTPMSERLRKREAYSGVLDGVGTPSGFHGAAVSDTPASYYMPTPFDKHATFTPERMASFQMHEAAAAELVPETP